MNEKKERARIERDARNQFGGAWEVMSERQKREIIESALAAYKSGYKDASRNRAKDN